MLKKCVNLLIIIFSIILIFIIISFIIDTIDNTRKEEIERESINYILKKNDGKPNKIKNTNKKIINYKMILEIPKIRLKKGILDKENKDNNIDKNVSILPESVYPNENGNIYIAAHSGNGKKSYFNKLVELRENDEVNLYYNNYKYTYLVKEIKEINKRSNTSIITNNSNCLILITCSQSDKSKYLIVVLTKKQNA